MQTALVYTRLSQDPDGMQTATARQEADGRALCEQRGWVVERVFEDAGISAYKQVRRPSFEEMLSVAAGRVVVCWRVDRLARAARDWGRLLALVDDHGTRIVGVADGVDTSTSGGRLTLGILAEVARNESATTSARIRRKHREIAEAGRWSGGGTRPFGVTPDRRSVDEGEAELIREAARRVLAGEALRAICIDWKSRGVVTPTGRPFIQAPLARLLQQARLAGAREHAGVWVATGEIPVILDEATVRQLRAVLRDPARRTTSSAVRVNLLPGFVFCGRCDARMLGRPRTDGVRRYLCPADTGRGGCNGCAILAVPLEELVRDRALAVLDTPRLLEVLSELASSTAADDDARVLVDLEESLAMLARDFYADHAITRGEYFAARETLTSRVEETRARLAQRARSSVAVDLVGDGPLAEQWLERGIDWRRAVLRLVVARVTIRRAVKGRNAFDERRVEIEWRT